MKCIKNNETGEIKRVSEENAVHQVSSGKWSFAPKQEWKKIRDLKEKFPAIAALVAEGVADLEAGRVTSQEDAKARLAKKKAKKKAYHA